MVVVVGELAVRSLPGILPDTLTFFSLRADDFVCELARSNPAFLLLPKNPNNAGLDWESLPFEPFDAELRTDDSRDRPFDWLSFRLFLWPTVSLVGSVQETSNIM